MMRNTFYGSHFRRDFKLAAKRGLDTKLLRRVMKCLENDAPLDEKYRNHPLTGSYAGHFECHIQPDWLLIYRLTENAVIFVRTGSHSDLF